MDKSPDAFRTISEVAEMLGTPAHVLRFWESRFPQIRPVKRAGGRRYYRPADVMLLTGIKTLLHDQGMTIRGVQKILREQGVRHVAALSGGELPDVRAEDSVADLEQALAESFGVAIEEVSIEVEPESATIIALETALRQPPRAAPIPVDALIEEADLPPALALADEGPSDLPAEITDLFSLLDDDPDPVHAPDPETSAPPAIATTPNVDAATATADFHPIEMARRLRRVQPALLIAQADRLAVLHAKLAGLHASLGPVPSAPIAPLP